MTNKVDSQTRGRMSRAHLQLVLWPH